MKKLDDLERLQQLKLNGVLTEEEFNIEKHKILNDNIEQLNFSTQDIEDSIPNITKIKNTKDIDEINTSSNQIKIKFNTWLILILIGIIAIVITIFVAKNIERENTTSLNTNQKNIYFKLSEDITSNEMTKIKEKIQSISNIHHFTYLGNNVYEVGVNDLNKYYFVKQQISIISGVNYVSEEPFDNKIQTEKENVKKSIEEYANSNIQTDDGTYIKYASYTSYKTSKNGIKVYKIKYDTSYQYEFTKIYYYQLVSLDESNTNIIKYSPFYVCREYSYSNGKKTTSFDNLKMEYDYEKIWE